MQDLKRQNLKLKLLTSQTVFLREQQALAAPSGLTGQRLQHPTASPGQGRPAAGWADEGSWADERSWADEGSWADVGSWAVGRVGSGRSQVRLGRDSKAC